MNRRDLLKWFGVGAVAVPIIGGMPKPEAAAVIVHAPVIDVPPAPKIYSPNDAFDALRDAFQNRELCEVAVYIRRKNRPYTVRIKCDAYMDKFNIHSGVQIVDVTSHSNQFRRFVPSLLTASFQCTGEPELIEGGMA